MTSSSSQPVQDLTHLATDGALPRRTSHEFARESLRIAILRGTLAANSRLVQADIAARLNISITPVREALRDLAAEGLVSIDPHRGATVRQISLDDLREIYELRLMLEPLAMTYTVGRISEAELQQAKDVHERMTAETDAARWVQLNHDFHGLLLQAARSPRLEEIIGRLQDGASRYVALSITSVPVEQDRGNREHRAILAALKRRDELAAVRAVKAHLETTLKTALTAFSDVTAAWSAPVDGARGRGRATSNSSPRRPASVV
jgi:DNA-binding GntR family transcriptional regulator